ncbi:ArsR family transcriptional regulator, partial [Streptomyces halstedii]
AGLANTRVVVSAEELAAIEDGIERVLAPYVTRDPAERPADGRGVLLMRYVLPEGSEGQVGEAGSEEQAGQAGESGESERAGQSGQAGQTRKAP